MTLPDILCVTLIAAWVGVDRLVWRSFARRPLTLLRLSTPVGWRLWASVAAVVVVAAVLGAMIWPAIAMHALIDLQQGLAAWIVLRKEPHTA